MSNNGLPQFTRLRFAKSKDPSLFQDWLESLGVRVQIYGSPQFDGESWTLWFVPDDRGVDIESINLDEVL